MPDQEDQALRVPIVQEYVTVDKVAVETRAVSVRTWAEERDVVIDDVVTREQLSVERVPMNRPVDVAPPQRDEGGTTIISIVEERAVVETRLFVIEEVRITRARIEERVAIPVTLRTMHAAVEQRSDTHIDREND